MRRLCAPVLMLFALVGIVAVPGTAHAEYCRPTMPDHPKDVRGYTFAGRVTGLHDRGEEHSFPLVFISMDLTAVYSNRGNDALEDGASIDIYSNPCDGIGLLGIKAGDELVLSTAYFDESPSTWNTAVWRVDGDRLRLLVLRSGDRVWYTNDRRIQETVTLEKALSLVSPDSVLPPTDSATGADPDAGTGDLGLAFGVGLGLAAWFYGRLLFRRRSLK